MVRFWACRHLLFTCCSPCGSGARSCRKAGPHTSMGVMSAPSSAPWPLETAPEPPRYADDSAEEIEDVDVTISDPSPQETDRPADRFLGPGDQLARLQRTGARARRGPRRAAAGAGALQRDLLPQPRRVLHGARRRAAAAGRPPASRPATRPASRPRSDSTASRPTPRSSSPGRRPCAPRRSCRSWPRPASASSRGRTSSRAEVAADAHAVHRAHPPRPDAAGRRPGSPVPLHLRPVAQPGRRRPRRLDRGRALRADQGAPAAAALRRHRRAGLALHPARDGDRGQPRRGLPRHAGAGDDLVPRHPQRGPRGGLRGGQPAARPRARAVPAPVRGARCDSRSTTRRATGS